MKHRGLQRSIVFQSIACGPEEMDRRVRERAQYTGRSEVIGYELVRASAGWLHFLGSFGGLGVDQWCVTPCIGGCLDVHSSLSNAKRARTGRDAIG